MCGGLLDERSEKNLCSECRRYKKQTLISYAVDVFVVGITILFFALKLFG